MSFKKIMEDVDKAQGAVRSAKRRLAESVSRLDKTVERLEIYMQSAEYEVELAELFRGATHSWGIVEFVSHDREGREVALIGTHQKSGVVMAFVISEDARKFIQDKGLNGCIVPYKGQLVDSVYRISREGVVRFRNKQ